jgi:hypothetical protein
LAALVALAGVWVLMRSASVGRWSRRTLHASIVLFLATPLLIAVPYMLWMFDDITGGGLSPRLRPGLGWILLLDWLTVLGYALLVVIIIAGTTLLARMAGDFGDVRLRQIARRTRWLAPLFILCSVVLYLFGYSAVLQVLGGPIARGPNVRAALDASSLLLDGATVAVLLHPLLLAARLLRPFARGACV